MNNKVNNLKMTDQEIKELGKEEMKNQYGYNANKPYYDNGFLLGYKKAQADKLILSGFTNWVAVNERLPTEQTDVITYSKEFEVRNGRCIQKGIWFVNGYSRLVNVTHWVELPKPPCL